MVAVDCHDRTAQRRTKLLEFIGAALSRNTVATRRDRDAPPWESDKEFELVDATTELAGVVQRLVLADRARSEEGANSNGEDVCMDNLVVTRVLRVQNKVLWEDFRRRQGTIRQRSMLEGTGSSPPRAQRLYSNRGDVAGVGDGTGECVDKLFPRIVENSDVNELDYGMAALQKQRKCLCSTDLGMRTWIASMVRATISQIAAA